MPIWRRRPDETALKIFYAADLHGSEKCFGKFLNAASYYDVGLLILGGDLTGKALVPVVRREDGGYEARFLGRTAVAHDEAELREIEKQVRLNGFYPYRCDLDELRDLQDDEALRKTKFEDVMRRDVSRWLEMADERLRETSVRCLAMPGNDDGDFVGEVLAQAQRIENCDERVIDVEGFQVLSLGYSNPTPWHTPRELPEEEIRARIARLAGKLDPGRPAIFNLHAPPYDSGLDSAPEIGEDLRLVGGAAARTVPVGSRAVRQAVEEFQPMLSLHGHIHESRGAARINGSVCLNPGSEYNVGILRGVIVGVGRQRVLGYQFVSA